MTPSDDRDRSVAAPDDGPRLEPLEGRILLSAVAGLAAAKLPASIQGAYTAQVTAQVVGRGTFNYAGGGALNAKGIKLRVNSGIDVIVFKFNRQVRVRQTAAAVKVNCSGTAKVRDDVGGFIVPLTARFRVKQGVAGLVLVGRFQGAMPGSGAAVSGKVNGAQVVTS